MFNKLNEQAEVFKAYHPGVGPIFLLTSLSDSFAELTADLLLPMKSNTFQTIINGSASILRIIFMNFILFLIFLAHLVFGFKYRQPPSPAFKRYINSTRLYCVYLHQ